ncbi:T9SS type A sorting domain-containing protein [Winogradskyella sp. R77965]|uniref:T9SS type A sorting domain-containing protein n=1 Tax=Winogradskyella sp. R77965 TaxID=3093872 RepID=UPI0037DC630A
MKLKLLLILTCVSSLLSYAQITKAEAFTVGTKLAFYPNQCGNTIPEAANKLTFCDGINNLGVVERSYGLNDRRVERMLPNYFNADEFYVTGKGLSIRNTDGTWENIPNVAIPTFNTQNAWTNAATIKNGLVQPDGKIIIQATGANYGFNIYDRTQKTFTPVNFPSNRFPYLFAYDMVRDLTWIIAFGGGANGRFLYTYDGTDLIPVQELITAGGISTNINSVKLIYKDDHLYIGSTNGLFKIDITNYITSNVVTTQYNSTTTPGLPFDRTLDLQFNSNDQLWLAQSNNNNSDGGLIKFDIINETHEIYQLERESNTSLNHSFQKLAIDNSGKIWATAISSSSLYTLTFPGDVETWVTTTDAELTALGVPITYVPNNIYFRNNQFYFTTVDFSSGSNSNYEVIINNNDTWSGRNDDALGNLSTKMNRRFTNVKSDANGGVWWFNAYDDIVIYRDSDDNHQSIAIENMTFTADVDDDNKAIVKGGSPNELRKIDFPNVNSIQGAVNQATYIKRVADQVWVYDRNLKRIDAYRDDAIVASYDLDEDWYTNSGFEFAIDDNADAWFARYLSGNLTIKKFDINTLTTTTYTLTDNISSIRKICAAPNGALWFVGGLGAVYYDGSNFTSFLAPDYSEIYSVVDAVVDSNGKLYMLNNDNASIITIENPTDTNPIIANTSLENANSVLPSLDHYRPGALTIDSEGSIWTHASQNVFKLIDNDFATEYIPQPTVLSINEQELVSKIKVYPNPTKGQLTVQTDLPIDVIKVSTFLGQNVATFKNTDTIDISDLSSGIYVLNILSESTTFKKKIILK